MGKEEIHLRQRAYGRAVGNWRAACALQGDVQSPTRAREDGCTLLAMQDPKPGTLTSATVGDINPALPITRTMPSFP